MPVASEPGQTATLGTTVEPSAGGEPVGVVIPAPGSDSEIFPPNPGAIVVFLDAGHGGCLDWGVANPFDNTRERAEKTMTLEIALLLRERLEEAGAQVVLSRDGDDAVAGDVDPDFGCEGPPFRDANGDGEVGFDEEGFTLLRDELTARIDMANLARADVFVSIHINSITENGEVFEIAATQTYFTDETPWGDASARLAEEVQRGVTDALGSVATYDRQDRGVQAVNYYVIAPPLTEESEEEHEPRARPRGIQMPGVLAEVGSMSLEAESELLSSPSGQDAVAAGLFDGIAAFLDGREHAVRYDALIEGGQAGVAPAAIPGDGPPFWAPAVDAGGSGPIQFDLRLTNTGTLPWPDAATLSAGFERTDEPYLAARPAETNELPIDVPPLGPGESVMLAVTLDPPVADGRHVAWISLSGLSNDLHLEGSPALQIALP